LNLNNDLCFWKIEMQLSGSTVISQSSSMSNSEGNCRIHRPVQRYRARRLRKVLDCRPKSDDAQFKKSAMSGLEACP